MKLTVTKRLTFTIIGMISGALTTLLYLNPKTFYTINNPMFIPDKDDISHYIYSVITLVITIIFIALEDFILFKKTRGLK